MPTAKQGYLTTINWSILIPTYNPSDLLKETIHSIVCQLMNTEDKEVILVDDCSKSKNLEDLLDYARKNGVRVHANNINLGLAGNWNRCIDLAQGKYVHLLHQDDIVYPGFYESMERGLRSDPSIGMAFCRHEVEHDDSNVELSTLEMASEGILRDWMKRLAMYQRIQCPSVVVKNEAYKELGGFSNDFCYALDWEMWARIASRYAVWYTPKVLARYRSHSGNETSRLKKLGKTIDDEYRVARRINTYLPKEDRNESWRKVRRSIANQWLSAVASSLNANEIMSGASQFCQAIKTDPTLILTRTPFDYTKWCIKLIARKAPRAR